LATLKRKIEARFHEKKVSPGRPVQQFIAELDVLLQNLHDIPLTSSHYHNHQINVSSIPDQTVFSSQFQRTCRITKTKNYGLLVKRLRHKFRLTNTIIRKTDKSKVFHLGRLADYQRDLMNI
jgi:UDP-galactopyranose mutase